MPTEAPGYVVRFPRGLAVCLAVLAAGRAAAAPETRELALQAHTTLKTYCQRC